MLSRQQKFASFVEIVGAGDQEDDGDAKVEGGIDDVLSISYE